MRDLILNISKLSLGHHQRSLETQPDSLGLDESFNRPVRVEVELEKTARQLFLRVEVSSGGLFTCDRCLDEFPREMATSFSITYVMDGRSAEGLDKEEVQVLSPDTNIIDIGDDVRQYAMLALPQKLLCREDCAGLCPTCGVNKNRTPCSCQADETDPRWTVLKQILKN